MRTKAWQDVLLSVTSLPYPLLTNGFMKVGITLTKHLLTKLRSA